MRIHTDHLNRADLSKALEMVEPWARHVDLIVQGQHGSRSHRKAFEVALRGHGARHTRRPNSGITGADSSEYAATYDDWGWFALGVLSLDPSATVGPYKGRDDFWRQTNHKYQF